MTQVIKQIKAVERLHRRHTAKLFDKLEEINTPKIIVDAVLKQFSFYSEDIKNQVIEIDKYEYQHRI